jgi:hypothetical protein
MTRPAGVAAMLANSRAAGTCVEESCCQAVPFHDQVSFSIVLYTVGSDAASVSPPNRITCLVLGPATAKTPATVKLTEHRPDRPG